MTEETKNPNIEEARQHFKDARTAMHESIEALVPAEYREKRRKVRKQFLMGLRKLLDAAIDRTEKKSTPE